MTSIPAADGGDAADAAAVAAIETGLAEIWRCELGRKGQDTGAHIMQINVGLRRMIRFTEAAEARFGVKIPLTAFMRLGTIRALAPAIASGTWPAPSPLVLLRDGVPDQVLYVVSAGGGLVLELCELAMLIDFPGQIWALQLPGIDGEATPLTTMQAMARHHVDHVLRSGHKAPYNMLGYSFGGLVTLEMARLLHAGGHRLGMVGLLDSTCYEKFWPRPEWLRFFLKHTWRRFAETRSMSAGQAGAYLVDRVTAVARHVRRRFSNTPSDGKVILSIYHLEGLRPNFQRIYDSSILAFEAYNPQPIDCKITLFKSILGDPHACNPVGIWKRLVRHLEVVAIPGTHVNMVRKPAVVELAREVSRRLE